MTICLRNSFTLFLLLSFTLGCQFFSQVQKKIEESQKPNVITCTDGKCQLTVPGNWSPQKDLNDDANLQAGNLRAEQYAVIISELKADFTSEVDLNAFTEIVRKGVNETIKTPIVSENRPLTVNGYPAIQFDVAGSVENIKARWLYTIVGTPKNYHQILTWTLNSKYEANKPVFLDVINSFKEIEDSISSPPADTAKP